MITATAGLLLAGAPAFADSAHNDGINVGNDNDASIAPIQLCGNSVAVVGAVVDILSPQSGSCDNAPVGDHPSHKPDHEKPEKPGHGGDCDDNDCGGCDDCGELPELPGPGGPGPGGPGPGPAPAPAPAPSAPEQVSPAELPAAPSPVAVAGHAAVTG
ncbi:chaplin family protein [Saccharopolyspora sp. NPDC047091]|uniref:chaplin family protein n=1 Tax=Saccharopolyspora sp. NPDC047091 TaxID=3155924 RepID=UPI0033EC15CB